MTDKIMKLLEDIIESLANQEKLNSANLEMWESIIKDLGNLKKQLDKITNNK